MAGTTKFVEGWKTGSKTGQLSVGFAFGSAPLASTCSNFYDRTWYTASTSVRSLRTWRGRTHDLDDWGPGTATLVLDNRSRLFDPANSTGDYAGNVLPGVPVRVDIIRPGQTTSQHLWAGFVEGYELKYPGMRDATVTVKCVDGTKFLNLSAISSAVSPARTDYMIHDVLTAGDWPSSSGGWPVGATTGWRDFGVGLATGLAYRGHGAPALEMCRNLADSEAGAFLFGRDGKAFFRTRRWWALSFKSTEAVFGDDPSNSSELPYTHLELASDDYQLYNSVSVTRIRGAAQTTENSTSIGVYGKRVLAKSNLLCKASTDARKIARWLCKRYSNPGVRVEVLECHPRSSTKIWNVVDNGLGETYRVMRRPPGGGTVSQVCHVEGIENRVDVGENDWVLRLHMSPAELFPSSSL